MRASVATDHELHIGWSERIRSAWQKSVEGILETGQLLVDAKADLPHGAFSFMVSESLPFSTSTARRLMAIAESRILSDRAHVHALPAAWGTLYELTKLDDRELETAFEQHLIKPDLERQHVSGVRAQAQRALGRQVTERPKEAARRDFFAEMKTHTPPELRAILNAIPPEIAAEVAVGVADMLIGLLTMPPNSVGEALT